MKASAAISLFNPDVEVIAYRYTNPTTGEVMILDSRLIAIEFRRRSGHDAPESHVSGETNRNLDRHRAEHGGA